MNEYDFSGSQSLNREMATMLVGRPIGQGAFRSVYHHLSDTTLVVKTENTARSFCNCLEWDIWTEVNGTPLDKWFAPCEAISSNGQVLFQKKTTPAVMRELPSKVPACFTDLSVHNWGFYQGRIVCHDYGNFKFTQGTNLVKARWYDY